MIQNLTDSQYKMYQSIVLSNQKTVKSNSRRDDGRQIIMINQAVKCLTTRKSEVNKNGRKKPITAKSGCTTLSNSIGFYKWLQAIPFIIIYGSERTAQNLKKHNKIPWQTTPNGCNISSVIAKNSDQTWNSEINLGMHSRILRGFFCACNMRLRLHSAILLMADGVEESKDSPLVSRSGSSNSTLVCLLLLGTRKGSLKKPRGDCKMSIKSHSGNPPNLPDKIPLSWRLLAVIPKHIPVASSYKFALSALFRRFISADVRLPASFVGA